MKTARPRGAPTPWSHEGLEKRGYRKCPYCWRHLVKLEEHVAAHEAGLIAGDGRRTDRTPAEAKLWTERHQARTGASRARIPARTFVPRTEYERVLELPVVDIAELRKQVDSVTRRES